MAEIVDTSTKEDVPTEVIVPKKKSNKTMLVIVGIIAVILLCVCSIIVGIFLIIPQLQKDGTFPGLNLDEQFKSYITEYYDYSEDIDAKIEEMNSECDRTEEYNNIVDKDYYEEDVASLYTIIPQLLNEENACFDTYRNYELNKDKEFADKINDFDCSRTSEAQACAEFKVLQNELVVTAEQLILLQDQITADQIKTDLCYVKSLDDNFNNTAAKEMADDICYEASLDFTEEKDLLIARRNEALDQIDVIVNGLEY